MPPFHESLQAHPSSTRLSYIRPQIQHWSCGEPGWNLPALPKTWCLLPPMKSICELCIAHSAENLSQQHHHFTISNPTVSFLSTNKTKLFTSVLGCGICRKCCQRQVDFLKTSLWHQGQCWLLLNIRESVNHKEIDHLQNEKPWGNRTQSKFQVRWVACSRFTGSPRTSCTYWPKFLPPQTSARFQSIPKLRHRSQFLAKDGTVSK